MGETNMYGVCPECGAKGVLRERSPDGMTRCANGHWHKSIRFHPCPKCKAIEEELERLHTWDGLMGLLDEHYPAHIFTGVSGDEGARIVVLTRALDTANQRIEKLEALCREALAGIYPKGLRDWEKRVSALIDTKENTDG